MEAIAPLVAAAGNMAGGAAASALMGDTSYPKGGGIQGLTSANTGKSGISSAVQIDPTTALNFFESAANSFATQAQSGLSYYEKAIQTAGQQLTAGYAGANAQLSSLSQAGQAATDQYMKMLGLNTVSPTAGISSQVGALGDNFTNVSQQIAAAENIKDPTQRAAALASIKSNLGTALTTQQAALAQQGQQQVAGIQGPMDWSTALTTAQSAFNNAQSGQGTSQAALNQQYGLNSSNPVAGMSADIQKQYQQYIQQGNYAAANATVIMGKSQTDYQNQVNQANSGIQQQQSQLASQVGNLQSQYSQNYNPTASYFGYSGDEAQKQIESTPGYKFQLSQGLAAINASAAAGGMLSSGNTLVAANNYAQGQASTYYQNYMDDLNRAMGQGNAATMQMSSNYASLGTGLASLSQSQGQAGLNTYQNIGQALYNAYTNMGQTWNQDMLANMDAQNSMIQQSNQLRTQAGIAANQTQTANGYLSLEQARFGNTLANNQGYANSVNNQQWTLG